MTLNMSNVSLFAILLCCCVAAKPIQGAVFDWFFSTEQSKESQDIIPTVHIPYETKTEDEKFLEEALKFTDIMKSSALDICQHNVVLKLKTSCGSMTEEELAKMSVNLLNCQSAVDDRKIFPCSETMTLKQCTQSMDATMWNAYHMMNNRARAVCLASRRAEFQALAEMTINKLLTTSQEQVSRMVSLSSKQEELEELTAQTMGVVREGNVNIMIQQENLKNTQTTLQESVFHNLKELSRENALIAAGNRELDAIKLKLDETNKELTIQSLERSGYYQQVIKDIQLVQDQIASVSKHIGESNDKLQYYHAKASNQYDETIRNLEKINATISYLTKLFSSTHEQMEDRIEWIRTYLGESGEELNKIFSAILHVAYLLMGMLIASFLNLPVISRAALIIIIPFNLLLVCERKADTALEFSQITVILFFILTINSIMNTILSYVAPRKSNYYLTNVDLNNKVPTANGSAELHKKPTLTKIMFEAIKLYSSKITCWLNQLWAGSGVVINRNEDATNDSFLSRTDRGPHDNESTLPHTYTPFYNRINGVNNRVSNWIDQSNFPNGSQTPQSTGSVRSGGSRNVCGAMCRNGRACRKPSTPGRDYCRLHEYGSSIAGYRPWSTGETIQITYDSCFLSLRKRRYYVNSIIPY